MADPETGSPGEKLKISVLQSGQILLDGREVDLTELETALQQAKLQGSAVHYYRENPAGPAPPAAEAVLKLIVANRLRIALSTQPDFSENYVPPAAEPKPSNVIEFPGVETLFAKVRRHTKDSRAITVVRPDQMVYVMPAPPAGSINPQTTAGIKSLVPSDEPRNIAAVLAPGVLAGDPAKPPKVAELSRQVPFYGLLIGLAYVGHTVWVFEAIPSMLNAGCEDADVLVVDSNALAGLPRGWGVDAAGVMRNANILAYDRSRSKMGALRTAGEVPGKIEFPN